MQRAVIHLLVLKIDRRLVERSPKVSPIATQGKKNAPACGIFVHFATMVAHGPNHIANVAFNSILHGI